jgi:hypothetical protein
MGGSARQSARARPSPRERAGLAVGRRGRGATVREQSVTLGIGRAPRERVGHPGVALVREPDVRARIADGLALVDDVGEARVHVDAHELGGAADVGRRAHDALEPGHVVADALEVPQREPVRRPEHVQRAAERHVARDGHRAFALRELEVVDAELAASHALAPVEPPPLPGERAPVERVAAEQRGLEVDRDVGDERAGARVLGEAVGVVDPDVAPRDPLVAEEALVLLEVEHVIEIGERHAIEVHVARELEPVAVEVDVDVARGVAAVPLDRREQRERDAHPVAIEHRVALDVAQPEAVELEAREVDVPGDQGILEASVDPEGRRPGAREVEAGERRDVFQVRVGVRVDAERVVEAEQHVAEDAAVGQVAHQAREAHGVVPDRPAPAEVTARDLEHRVERALGVAAGRHEEVARTEIDRSLELEGRQRALEIERAVEDPLDERVVRDLELIHQVREREGVRAGARRERQVGGQPQRRAEAHRAAALALDLGQAVDDPHLARVHLEREVHVIAEPELLDAAPVDVDRSAAGLALVRVGHGRAHVRDAHHPRQRDRQPERREVREVVVDRHRSLDPVERVDGARRRQRHPEVVRAQRQRAEREVRVVDPEIVGADLDLRVEPGQLVAGVAVLDEPGARHRVERDHVVGLAGDLDVDAA